MRPRIKTVEERIADALMKLHGIDRKSAWRRVKEREMNIQMQYINQVS